MSRRWQVKMKKNRTQIYLIGLMDLIDQENQENLRPIDLED